MACDQQRIWWWMSSFLLGVPLLFVVVTTDAKAQHISVESVLLEPEFVQAYDTYYANLKGYGVEVLLAEFSDTVEDALISGSHVRTTSIRYKVRHFEDAVHKAIAHRLCPVSSGAATMRGKGTGETLKKTVVASIGPASTQVGVDISLGLYGRLSALLMRVLESTQPPRFCLSTNFQSLGG